MLLEQKKFMRLIETLMNHYFNAEDKPFNKAIPSEELSHKLSLGLNDKAASDDSMENFIEHYLAYSINTSHRNYGNQLWSKVEVASILGEVLSAITNTSMYTYEVAPVATLIEQSFVDYLGRLIWGEARDGVMTSGGSASNLQALMIARNTCLDSIKTQGLTSVDYTPVILGASNAHYSLKRACNILGLGHHSFIEVPVNSCGQMQKEDLEEMIEKLKTEKKRPFAVVSTAGTTIEGSFDDIESLAEVCHKEKLWFHVDGAYGASVLLSEKHKSLMKGIEFADSISWDFHKMLGINLPCAFLLTKNKGLLKETLTSNNDEYLFHDQEGSLDLGPKSIQCGRRTDVLKLKTSWLAYGKEGFQDRIDKMFQLAKSFAGLIIEDESFELLSEPQSINVCFRYKEKDGVRREAAIRSIMMERGYQMINFSSDQDGDFFRSAITRPDLTLDDFKSLLHSIKKVRDEI